MGRIVNNAIPNLINGVSQQPETSNPLSPKKSLINFKEQFNSLGVWRRAYNKDFYE